MSWARVPSLLLGKREEEVAGVKGVPAVSCSGESAPRIACLGHLVEEEKVSLLKQHY